MLSKSKHGDLRIVRLNDSEDDDSWFAIGEFVRYHYCKKLHKIITVHSTFTIRKKL